MTIGSTPCSRPITVLSLELIAEQSLRRLGKLAHSRRRVDKEVVLCSPNPTETTNSNKYIVKTKNKTKWVRNTKHWSEIQQLMWVILIGPNPFRSIGDVSAFHQLSWVASAPPIWDQLLFSPRRDNSHGNRMSYIGPYLIPILNNNQYLLLHITFSYGLITLTHVYGLSGLPQAFYLLFVGKCLS